MSTFGLVSFFFFFFFCYLGCFAPKVTILWGDIWGTLAEFAAKIYVVFPLSSFKTISIIVLIEIGSYHPEEEVKARAPTSTFQGVVGAWLRKSQVQFESTVYPFSQSKF